MDDNNPVLSRLQEIYDKQKTKAAAFWITFAVNSPSGLGETISREYTRFLN